MMKIGLIVPPQNTVNAIEWRRMLPPGIDFSLVRIPLHGDTESPEGKRALYADRKKALDALKPSAPDVVAYACTAGSMSLPLDGLTNAMSEMCGKPCVATAPALIEACRKLQLRKVAIATPYHHELNEHERLFFEACGIRMVRIKGL